MTSWCPVFINILIPKIVAFQEPLQKKTYNWYFLENEFNCSL
jgi:hypothetical protein